MENSNCKCNDFQRNFNCNCTDPQQRSAFSQINQPCNGTTRVYFEDFTCTEGSFQVEIFNNTSPPCTMTAIIEFQNGKTIERVVSNFGEFSFFAEDLQMISIRCDGNPTGNCFGFVSVNKLIRFCCDVDENCNCYDDHHDCECHEEDDCKCKDSSDSKSSKTDSKRSKTKTKSPIIPYTYTPKK